MKNNMPNEFLKDYAENFRRMGHEGAFKLLRARITFSSRYGHAWFMDNREQLEKRVKTIEYKVNREITQEKKKTKLVINHEEENAAGITDKT